MKPLDTIEEAIFSTAKALTSPQQRAAFLDQACGQNVALRQRLEALLEADRRADQFFASDPFELRAETIEQTAGPETPLTETEGTRVGRYKLLQKIGEGGMGVVYMAEQEEPVRRRVALKIIKLGMDTRQVVARFEAERQALALMDHPNIARVFDGGATETGRPYFVMELVQGVPITEFCNRNRLPTRERLKLFIAVCQAIQSAHQKGIIHRDIKPSNVLVTLHDGVPVPKVIDFGIAKATHQRLTEKTLFTNFASMIGTPAYMSPEQAEMTGLDTDTRTDIYALGVLLYELLTGTTPFPEKRLRSLGYGEMQRVIQEEEPQRPSTRLSTMANEQKSIIARNCGEELASLNNLLKGDLDWIVMKCLEKDRQRRYETSNGLSTDIQRHLTNEPVNARPPSTAYRFQKMIRRNRTAALATAAVALALILGAGFSTAAFVSERKARLQAITAERQRQSAHLRAESEIVKADGVVRFLLGVFEGVIPVLNKNGQYNATRRLLEVSDGLNKHLTNAPLAAAQVRLAIAVAYGDIGNYKERERQADSAEVLAAAAGEPGKKLVDDAKRQRLTALMWGSRDKAAAAELEQRALNLLIGHPPQTDEACDALLNVTIFQYFYGDLGKAEELAQKSLVIAADDTKHLSFRLTALDFLARIKRQRGSPAEVEAVNSQLVSLVSRLSLDGDEVTAGELQTYIQGMSSIGQMEKAEQVIGGMLEAISKDKPASHRGLRAALGETVARRGSWHKGLSILEESIELNEASLEDLITMATIAALAGNENLRHRTCILAAARFAAGAEGDSSSFLAKVLLLSPAEDYLLPLIPQLIDRAKTGSPWASMLSQLNQALLEYRRQRPAEALEAVEQFQNERHIMPHEAFEEIRAAAWFLKAGCQIKVGQHDAAVLSYHSGIRVHSPALREPGTPFSGYWFTDGCIAEILRREAAALLGDATPSDVPPVSKP